MWIFSGSPSLSATAPHSRRIQRSSIRHAPQSTIPRLAPELILGILEILAEDEARPNGKRLSLISTTTVCKAWAPISQALLFRTVALGTLRQCNRFVNAINTGSKKARFLRENVRSLEVLVSDEEDGPIIAQAAFANVLKLCPNVTDLRLFYYCLRSLDHSTLDILRTITAPISLSLRCAQDPSPLWDLLSIWPTIQHLEVASWETPSFLTTKPPASSAQWAPYEVRWMDESDSGEESLPRLLRPGSLRILQLLKTPSDQFFAALMVKHGPYLRSLRLRGIREEVVTSLENCTSLEEFKYMRVPSAALLAALPSSLEHLQFQNSPRKPTSIHPVLGYIESGGARRLRVVTYNCCGSPSDAELRNLVDICKRRKVTLKCYADNPPMEEREPFIRPASFPRPIPEARRKLVDPTKDVTGIRTVTYSPGSSPTSSVSLSPTTYFPSPGGSRAQTPTSGRLRRGSSPDGFFGITLGM